MKGRNLCELMDPKIIHLAIGKGWIKRSQEPGSAMLLLTLTMIRIRRGALICQTIFKIIECSFHLLHERRPFRQNRCIHCPSNLLFLSHIKGLAISILDDPSAPLPRVRPGWWVWLVGLVGGSSGGGGQYMGSWQYMGRWAVCWSLQETLSISISISKNSFLT